MGDSLRKQIYSAIQTRLATITTGNGYRTNIGSNVFAWKSKNWESHQMPGVDLRDPSTEIADYKMKGNGSARGGVFSNVLRIEFIVASQISTDNSTNADIMDDVRDAIDDIYEMINVDHTWGGLARRTTPLSDEMDIDQQEKTTGGGKVSVNVYYNTEAFNPDTAG